MIFFQSVLAFLVKLAILVNLNKKICIKKNDFNGVILKIFIL